MSNQSEQTGLWFQTEGEKRQYEKGGDHRFKGRYVSCGRGLKKGKGLYSETVNMFGWLIWRSRVRV